MNNKTENKRETKKPKVWSLFFESLRGSYGKLVLAAVGVIMAAACSYIAPFVTSFTLDYVIRGESPSLPAFIMNWVEAIGGRSYFAQNLIVCGAAFFLFTVLASAFAYMRRRYTAYASESMAKGLRDRLYRHLNAVPYDYHKHVSTGDLVQRCTSDVETVRRFLSVQALELVRTVVMLALALSVMFSIHTNMTLISMALLPILAVSSFVYFRYVRRYFTASDEAEGELSTQIQENLTGVRVVRAFGQQRREYDKFTRLNENYRSKTERLISLLAFYWGVTDALGYVQIALSLIFGIVFYIRGEFTLGNVYLFIRMTGMLTWPMRQMGRILADMGKASVSLGRLKEILDAPVETEPGKAEQPDLMGDISFEHVCFGYDAPDDVLKDINFTVHPGQTVAILGSTGSGKSSLVQLLQRLYTCTKGAIYINGVNINDIDHAHLRRNIGIVLQEPFLYSRSIRENIRIVDPTADDDRVYEVARTASVHDVIMGFENGYETVVGERGVTLSGGQQQRVAIARTLMQNAPILVFDDSMSAVDTETDGKIRDALYRVNRKGIVFLISHRITTLCEADVILVLEHGRLVQQGTHEQLLHEDGLYRRIAIIQDAIAEKGA